MPSAAQMFIAKWGREPKVNRTESAILEAMSPEMRALILRIDGINAEMYLSRRASEQAELSHRLAELNLAVSRLALAEDEAALEMAERALVERREQDARDEAAREERQREAARQEAEAEVVRKVQEHNERVARERREQRDPIVTKQRALMAELNEASHERAVATAKVDDMTRRGYDESFPVFVTVQKDVGRLSGYVSRINTEIADVTRELEALPLIAA